jgi:aryl-alcohol dehydrogenase-like predicted oxidoreductase
MVPSPDVRSRRLGKEGPDLSVIGFGALEVGNREQATKKRLSDADLLNIIRAAPDAGIDWIDTAEVYGDGNSERLVGRALVGRRDDVLIATKVAERAANYGGTGFRPEEIRAACDASLQRLRTDRIDLYQLHWFPRDGEQVPIEETWGAMAGLVEDGRVRFIGVSNFNRRQIERCLTVRHVDSLQAQFSPVTPALADLIAWCGEQGIGVVAYGPLGYGLLRPTMMTEEEMTQMLGDLLGPEAPERWGFAALELVRELQPIAQRVGISLSHLALAWNLAQPGVTSAIAGSTNPGHIRSNAEAGDLQLDDGTVKEIGVLVDRYRASGARPLDQFGIGRGLDDDTRS